MKGKIQNKTQNKTHKFVPKKTPNQPGKYVYKPLKSVVLLCSCGDKYIKTRRNQVVCLRCILDTK